MKTPPMPRMDPPWLKVREPRIRPQTHPTQPGLTDEEREAAITAHREKLDAHHEATLADIDEQQKSTAFTALVTEAEREDEIRTLFAKLYGRPVAPPAPVEEAVSGEGVDQIPEALAALVPRSVAEKDRRVWLASRWIELNSKRMDNAKPPAVRKAEGIEPMTATESADLTQIEPYNINWFD